MRTRSWVALASCILLLSFERADAGPTAISGDSAAGIYGTGSEQRSDADPDTRVEYKDKKYRFVFSLPASWKGYRTETGTWNAYVRETDPVQTEFGALITIVHPLWTQSSPRQDITILVFTVEQWSLVEQKRLVIGTQEAVPSELGRNAKYVFGLPYHFADGKTLGAEEVRRIVAGHPLLTY